jgi:hypothetical protein
VFQPRDTKEEKSERFTYISFRPVPLLFIFFSMVLACTTIVECGLDTWSRYSARSARIQLKGSERAMYADASTSLQQVPLERGGTVDVEKRAEAQNL